MKVNLSVTISVMQDGKYECCVNLLGKLNRGSLRYGDDIPFLVGKTVDDFVKFQAEDFKVIQKESKINEYRKCIKLSENGDSVNNIEEVKRWLKELEAS